MLNKELQLPRVWDSLEEIQKWKNSLKNWPSLEETLKLPGVKDREFMLKLLLHAIRVRPNSLKPTLKFHKLSVLSLAKTSSRPPSHYQKT